MARTAWEGSTRRRRLPANWDSELRPAVFARDGDVCWWCGEPGADEIDHKKRGDDHRLENLGPIHGWRTGRDCHKKKSSQEGHAARLTRNRPPDVHPALR